MTHPAIHCGTPLPARARFCPRCGQALPPPEPTSEPTPAGEDWEGAWTNAADPPALAAFFAASDVFDQAVLEATRAYWQRRHVSVFLDNEGPYRLEYEFVTYNVVLPTGVLLAIPPLPEAARDGPQAWPDEALRRAIAAERWRIENIMRQRYYLLASDAASS